MNYRVLEDLVNILVKKSGDELDESTAIEDINILNERANILKSKNEELKNRIENEDYIIKRQKNKDLEEKKYLEDCLEEVKRHNNSKLSSKEIDSLEEQIKLLNIKINNKDYTDNDKKDIDNKLLTLLNKEVEETNKLIDSKRNQSSFIGLEILEDFKSNKSLSDVKEKINLLIKKATERYELTSDEIGEANIFELMDEYSKRKNEVFKRLETDNYGNEKSKNEINKKCKYHHDRIISLKDTMDAIVKRKDELESLIRESMELYDSTTDYREQKENDLNQYIQKFASLTNIEVYKEEFIKYLDYLKEDIAKNKYLENKYCEDILAYKDEIRNLEINNRNINSLLLEEEKCLDILNDQLEQLEENNIEKINDEILYLTYTERLEKLSNEQQYYYVNIDVIEKEIINLWKKNVENKFDNKESNEIKTNMYEEKTDDSEFKINDSANEETLEERTTKEEFEFLE